MAKDKKSSKGRKVRVDFRKNRTQPARDKSWTRQFREHGFENSDAVLRQPHKPKGDLSRKRTIIEDAVPEGLDLRDGVVAAMRGLIADVDADGQRWPCTVRRVLRTRLIEQRHPVTVGDRVQFYPASGEGSERSGVIYNVYERHSRLTRRAGDRVHVIAANVDQVLVVASAAQPALKSHLVDRYLVAAHAGNIHPVICINKIDLPHKQDLDDVAAMYRRIGYTVVLTSVIDGAGLDELRSLLAGRTTVVVGQSGVGKSSLLNGLQPGLGLQTAAVSETNEKGRHTTTVATLLPLDFGGYVVDTPGVRSYEMADISRGEYELHLVEFVEHVQHCKFPDCTHIHEDGCAVLQAVEDGRIDPRRYESYVHLYQGD